MHRSGLISLSVAGSLLLCAANNTTGCNSSGHIGPSNGEIIGAAVGIAAGVAVGTVVLIDVNRSHHTIKGCVTSGPDGLQVLNEKDSKTYTLTGVTASVKPGDIIQVHGSKQKGEKDSAGNQDFKVEKMSRDFGPCKAVPAPANP